MWEGASIPYFKINVPFFSSSLFFLRIFQPPGPDRKNGKQDFILRALSLSRICYLLNFLNLYIPLWLRKFFKFMVFRLLKKVFASQQTKSRHFYSCPLPPGQSSLQSSYCYPDTQGDYSSPQAASVRKSLPPSRKREEKTMKLSLTGFEADWRL